MHNFINSNSSRDTNITNESCLASDKTQSKDADAMCIINWQFGDRQLAPDSLNVIIKRVLIRGRSMLTLLVYLLIHVRACSNVHLH